MAFKFEKQVRGEGGKDGFYLTSMRFPLPLAKKITKQAQIVAKEHGRFSFSEVVVQAMDEFFTKHGVPNGWGQVDLKASKGTTAKYNKAQKEKAAAKAEKDGKAKPAAKKPAEKPAKKSEPKAKPEKKAASKPAPKAKPEPKEPEPEVADEADLDVVDDAEV